MKNITLLCISFLFSAIAYSRPDSAPVVPVNDECSGAITLPVSANTNCVGGTTAVFTAATVSAQPNTCTTLNGGDIWFQFTATSSMHTISLSNFTGTAQPAVLVLYDGDCGTLTQLYCSINNVINATNLVPGTSYKLRTYYNLASPSNAATFAICVSTPPAPSSSNQTDCVVTTINYSFETPPPPAPTIYPTFVNHNTVQGWRTTASDQMMEFWVDPNYENVPAYQGTQFIELNANLVSGVYQDYATPQPTVFNYGFAHRGRQGTDTCQLLAGPPGGPYSPVQTVTTGNTAWSYNTGSYTVPAGQTVTRFIFQSVSSVGGASVGNYLDAITFTANNGILSSNPYDMNCGNDTANINAAGTGTWSAHADNPSATVIGNPSANNTTITGFSVAGTYYFDWTTAYCTSTLEISYAGNEPPEPVGTDVFLCQGQQAAPLTAEALPNHTLNWYPDDGAGGPPVPSTAALGTTNYYVSQTSPNGCESIIETIVVTVSTATAPNTDFSLPAEVCGDYGTVTPTLGANFTTGGQFTSSTGLAIDPASGAIDPAASTPGAYTVTYEIPEDLSQCIIGGTHSANITINDAPGTPDVTVTQPGCETPSGSITVNAPLGAGFVFSIDGSTYQPEPDFTNLAGGSYTVYVKSASGCISELSDVAVNTPPVLVPSATLAITQPTCTSATGAITVNAPLGAGYSYSIDGTNYQTATSFNNLPPGDYNVTVQNSDGCTSLSNTATVNVPPATPEVANVTVTQPTCTVNTGSIEINSPVGGGLSYSLDGVSYQASASFTNLIPGNYSVYVKNSAGCTSMFTPAVISAAAAAPPPATLVDIQPDCTTSTGTLNVLAPLGPEYSYSIDGVNFQSGTEFSNLTAGFAYMVTCRNLQGCESVTIPVAMNAAPVIPSAPVVTVSQPSCGDPGNITVTSPLGAGLMYSINGVNFQANPVFTGPQPGNYTVTVKSGGGCTASSGLYTINAGLTGPGTPVLFVTQTTCISVTGSIAVTSPVNPGLQYSIDGTTYGASANFTNLAPGPYTVYVKAQNGCIATANAVIDPQPLTPSAATATVIQPGCSTPGSITVTAPLGIGFTYSINGTSFQSSPSFANIAPGNYTITVKTSAGCTSVSSGFTVNPVPGNPAAATVTVTQPACGVPTGTVTVLSPVGPDFVYSIGSGFQASPVFDNVPSGTITLTVQNSAGCTSTKNIVVNPAPALPAIADVTVVHPDCDHAKGTVTINSPTGSNLSYSINGVSFQTGTYFANLSPGSYTVTVKSSDGCTSVTPLFTIDPQPLIADAGTITGGTEVCEGETLQLANLVTGGTWSSSNTAVVTISATGEITAVAEGLTTIAYDVPGTATECAGQSTITFTVNPLPVPAIEDAYICEDPVTGEYATTYLNTGLSAGYTFAWEKDGTALTEITGDIAVDEPGVYKVTATNIATGCVGEATATVGVSSEPIAVAEVGSDFHNNQTVAITITGGSGSYEYNLDGGPWQDEPVFPNISQGEYLIGVRDKNGCGEIVLTVNALNFPRFFSPNGDGERDTWNIEGMSSYTTEISIFDRYGKAIAVVRPGNEGWDGTFNGASLPATDYWFIVKYVSQGKDKEFKAHFSLIR